MTGTSKVVKLIGASPTSFAEASRLHSRSVQNPSSHGLVRCCPGARPDRWREGGGIQVALEVGFKIER